MPSGYIIVLIPVCSPSTHEAELVGSGAGLAILQLQALPLQGTPDLVGGRPEKLCDFPHGRKL